MLELRIGPAEAEAMPVDLFDALVDQLRKRRR